jgi:hypothetical protein
MRNHQLQLDCINITPKIRKHGKRSIQKNSVKPHSDQVVTLGQILQHISQILKIFAKRRGLKVKSSSFPIKGVRSTPDSKKQVINSAWNSFFP